MYFLWASCAYRLSLLGAGFQYVSHSSRKSKHKQHSIAICTQSAASSATIATNL